MKYPLTYLEPLSPSLPLSSSSLLSLSFWSVLFFPLPGDSFMGVALSSANLILSQEIFFLLSLPRHIIFHDNFGHRAATELLWKLLAILKDCQTV